MQLYSAGVSFTCTGSSHVIPTFIRPLSISVLHNVITFAGNGERSIIVDLNNPSLMPAGWWEHPVPILTHWTDVSVYELHIRDFR